MTPVRRNHERHLHLSNEKIAFQWLFMLMTVQPLFFASSYSGYRQMYAYGPAPMF
jgi:hypothetical protein